MRVLKERDFVKAIVLISNGDWPIKVNTMGAIVSVLANGEAYEVEFLTDNFNLFDVVTVLPNQIEPLWTF
jgi:hypothetical protein